MEIKSVEFSGHVTKISAILRDECKPSRPGPLVITENLHITIPTGPNPPFREVTTDLGRIESALELPIPAKANARKYWVGLHEGWTQISKHKVRFNECSLRLYVSREANQEPTHFLRLEWIAPDAHSGIYQGRLAGHPHWHIDRSVLAGSRSLLRPLEKLDERPELEEFSALTVSNMPAEQQTADSFWVQNIHLPAQAGWMRKWIETSIPHQCEPDNCAELENWWSGSLRYFVHELSSLRI